MCPTPNNQPPHPSNQLSPPFYLIHSDLMQSHNPTSQHASDSLSNQASHSKSISWPLLSPPNQLPISSNKSSPNLTHANLISSDSYFDTSNRSTKQLCLFYSKGLYLFVDLICFISSQTNQMRHQCFCP